MKKLCLFLLISTIGGSIATSQTLGTQADSVSYSAGIIIGKNLKMQGLENLNEDLFLSAVKAVMEDNETVMKPSDAEQYFREFQKKKSMAEAESNRVAGEQFLEKNAKREGVITTESGLQYEVIEMGDGPKPKPADKVYVHYHGTLIDGTVFDSSIERGEPIEFPLNRVISGWTEVLQLMPVGSTFKAYIPFDLAYGERGAGATIGPYSTLIFEIRLLEIR